MTHYSSLLDFFYSMMHFFF